MGQLRPPCRGGTLRKGGSFAGVSGWLWRSGGCVGLPGGAGGFVWGGGRLGSAGLLALVRALLRRARTKASKPAAPVRPPNPPAESPSPPPSARHRNPPASPGPSSHLIPQMSHPCAKSRLILHGGHNHPIEGQTAAIKNISMKALTAPHVSTLKRKKYIGPARQPHEKEKNINRPRREQREA